MTTVGRRELGREAWDALVDASPEAWLWHRYDLQDAFATWPEQEDESFAIVEEGEAVAIAPLHLVTPVPRRGRPTTLNSLGGPALHPALERRVRERVEGQVVTALARRALDRKAAGITVTLATMAPAFRGEDAPRANPLLRLGATNAGSHTWIVDLRGGADAVWSAMDGRARTAVRKAEKAGVVLREAGPADLDVYYALHRATYGRTGVRPHPRAYFEAIWEHYLGAGKAFVLLAELDGRAIGAQNFAVDKGGALYWTGASDDIGLRSGANSLLHWSALRRLADAGVPWCESGEAFFHGAEPKHVGLSEFKRSFGGRLEPVHRGTFDTSTHAQQLLRVLAGLRRPSARARWADQLD